MSRQEHNGSDHRRSEQRKAGEEQRARTGHPHDRHSTRRGVVLRCSEASSQEIRVRGLPEHTAKLVTINVREPGQTPGLAYRLHAVGVDGRWAWILGPRFLDSIARGRRLDGSKLRGANA